MDSEQTTKLGYLVGNFSGFDGSSCLMPRDAKKAGPQAF